MAQTIDKLWLTLETRSAYFWEMPGAMLAGWKPMWFPLRSWNPLCWPLVVWFGIICLKCWRALPGSGPQPITYAVVDGPPDDWRGLKIFDLDTGEEVDHVIEVNATEGWLIRYRKDERGYIFPDPDQPEEAARERITGRFQIRRPG